MTGFDSLCGMVLAAGAGSRYGSPKVLAENGSWLGAAVDALREGGCEEVIVVLGAAVVEVPPGARALINLDWKSGMAGSLRVGLGECLRTEHSATAIMPVDTPDVGGDVVRRVAAAATQTGLARAWFGDVPGHPVVMERRWWSEASRGATGDEGARHFLAGRSDVVAVQCDDLATGLDRDHRTC